MSAVVVAENITKKFGEFTAVDDVSLRLEPGEIVGLLGANGAGKTTLLRVLLGLEVATDGRAEVFGSAPASSDRHALGYVPQGLGLYLELTVDQNVAFVAEAFGVDDLPPLPPTLAEVRDRQAASIGLGRQRQLAFHCALLHRPTLLILDEPTSGVDPLARARLWDTIHEQAENGVAVLVTTHYMQEAEQCSRLVMMSRGKKVAAGTTAEITSGTRAVVVHADDWAGAFAALGDADLPVVLSGRTSRVAGTAPDEVSAALRDAGVEARLEEVPATLEETMVLVERAARDEA
ncbi:ribosome-dependent ATPase [Paraoerskovia marina]|uniref:Ribosome-dependent ATPase n=1 Tax=Paraoerskovia marina TaxID=545619 RepID=A0A1H1MP95_9CELL|nr:ABC transporter ATP-binding protein [Paraoerskovia marina]SDR88588.1 ribosome-dependent ATPase [Paraoerskovia marina]